MEKNKDDAVSDYIRIVKQSWTYQRMTPEEQERFDIMLHDGRIFDIVKGSYATRVLILGGIYYAFLMGLGYDGDMWREPTDT